MKDVEIRLVYNTENNTYEIYFHDHLSAVITIDAMGYHNVSITHDTPGMVYKAIAILWEEFDRRGDLTDVTMTVPYLSL